MGAEDEGYEALVTVVGITMISAAAIAYVETLTLADAAYIAAPDALLRTVHGHRQ